MKQIIFVNETSNLGGAEINLELIASHLYGTQYEPLVVVPRNGPLVDRLLKQKIPVQIISGCPHWSVSFLVNNRIKIPNIFAWVLDLLAGLYWSLHLYWLFIQKKPSIIQTNSMLAHIFAGLSGKAAGHLVVWHFQDIVDPSSGLGIYYKLLILLAKFIPNRIICISDIVAEQFLINVDVAPKVDLLWNTIDVTKFSSLPNTSNDSLDHSFKIGTVARFTPWKGQEVALKSAKVLKEQGVPFIWYFVGDTTLGSEKYREDLKNLTQEFGLEDYVKFLGWLDDISAFYHTIDILVHVPIESEPFGLVVAEALASGLPALVTHVGALDKNSLNSGFIHVPRNDPNAIADSLISLWKKPDELKLLGQQAFQFAQQNFSLEKYINRLILIYDRMLFESTNYA